MGEKIRRRSLLERTAQALDLPADAVAGLPLVELRGRTQVRVENHRGLLAYGPGEIHINGGKLVVRVRGKNLVLRGMTAQELVIAGEIAAVELE